GKLRDPPFQVVVGVGEAGGFAFVPGRAVGTGEPVQALELLTRVGDVTAHGRVRPTRVPVSVETQVQRNEFRDGRDRRLVEPHRTHAFGRHLRPDHFVVVETHPASRL